MFLDDLLKESFTTLLVIVIIYAAVGIVLYLYWKSSKQPEFNKIVIIVAICILLIMLTTAWLAIKNDYKSQRNPSNPPSCPDYWYVEENITDDGLKYNVCKPPDNLTASKYNSYYKNKNKTGDKITVDAATFDTIKDTYNFNGSKWTGSTGLCNKYNWAKYNNEGVVAWDGITNQSSPC